MLRDDKIRHPGRSRCTPKPKEKLIRIETEIEVFITKPFGDSLIGKRLPAQQVVQIKEVRITGGAGYKLDAETPPVKYLDPDDLLLSECCQPTSHTFVGRSIDGQSCCAEALAKCCIREIVYILPEDTDRRTEHSPGVRGGPPSGDRDR
jgi:hypothetical protein